MSNRKANKQSGFTIVELMIATAVFATVLLVCASGLLEIGRVYYKGVAIGRTQETARLIMDDVADSLRFQYGTVDLTGGAPTGYFCIGTKKYTYNKLALVENAGYLNRYTDSDCSPGGESDETGLLGERMMLQKLEIEQIGVGSSTRLYKVTVRVATAPSDGLETPVTGTSNCKNERGPSQFCATVELSTVVMRRV